MQLGNSTAFGPQTAGVMHVYDVNAAPPLAELVKRAHASKLPALVDAAGELPPRSNLRDIIATGYTSVLVGQSTADAALTKMAQSCNSVLAQG